SGSSFSANNSSNNFGPPPDFSKGNKDLEKLVAESSKTDPAIEKMMAEIKKKLEAQPSPEEQPKVVSPTVPDFSSLIADTLAAIRAINQNSPQSVLLQNAPSPKKSTRFKPLRVPQRGLASGYSPGSERALIKQRAFSPAQSVISSASADNERTVRRLDESKTMRSLMSHQRR
ncbi:MAG: hypothetical protein EB120_09065, partial [Proteobacteria bacterium]|nr:hypothetical protein [Pseudomonadota bacterium]